MYISKKRIQLPVWGLLLFVFGCQDSEMRIDDTYVFHQPAHFPETTYTLENNPVTEKGFLLGKKLFNDPILSRDGSVACSNCHQQGTAFADSQQHPLSKGVEDREGIRNAPSLTNLAFLPEFFWDGGVTHLDFVPLNAIEAEFEMDETIENVIVKLNKSETYRALFKGAFDMDEVTSPYMLHALSQFMVMMISDNSRYDQYLQGEEVLSSEELAGMELFESKCESCHAGVLQSDFSYRNNGLDAMPLDSGRNRITENSQDWGKFRVPSLRNVELTSPYMHDGRFETLEEVLEHYNSGIQSYETLDPSLKSGISISDDERAKIISFLKTLTDRDFTRDPKFFIH